MRARRQREVWHSLGQEDADWGVLTVRDRRHQGWAGDLDTFYASGLTAVEECLRLASPPGWGRALDFGAGTGRLSLALATHFKHVISLDVSPGMLDVMAERAQATGVGNVTPLHVDEFQPSADCDFAISLLVLQHLAGKQAVSDAVGLIAAAVRPGGVAVLEFPERPLTLRARLQPRLRVYAVLRALGVPPGRLHRAGFSGISMLCLRDMDARETFDHHGLAVIRRIDRHDHDYDYVRWVVRKDG